MYKFKKLIPIILLILFVAISLLACKGEDIDPFEDDDFLLLSSYMTGDFDSEQQHTDDSNFAHVDVRMKRIWADDTDCVWMYVEQGIDGYNPYRQRVYQLGKLGDNEFVSKIYGFKSDSDKNNAVGAWQDEDPLSDLTISNFSYKTGCDVFISKEEDGSFHGETDGENCTTTYQGQPAYTITEVYVTSEYLQSEDKIINQDTGYQIGGSFHGPYMFDKLENFDPELDPQSE